MQDNRIIKVKIIACSDPKYIGFTCKVPDELQYNWYQIKKWAKRSCAGARINTDGIQFQKITEEVNE